MNIHKQLFILLFGLFGLSATGQTSKKTINYQAFIIDPKSIDIPGASIVGQPLNKGNVCLRFSLLNSSGGLDYEETQQVTTDEFGLVSVDIGAGSPTQPQASNSTSTYSNFESIVWNANVKKLIVSVSFDACKNFKQVSSQTLHYTPYALYAEAVDYKNVRDSPTKLSQFVNDAGYLIPKDLDPLKIDIKTNTADILKNTFDIKTNTAEIKTNTADILKNTFDINTNTAEIKTNTANIVSHTAEIKSNRADIESNSVLIGLANQRILENKKANDEAFLIVNQSIKDLGGQLVSNTNAIVAMEGKINEQQSLLTNTRNQMNASTSTLSGQISEIQGQLNSANSTIGTLTGDVELISNKSIAINLGGASPSDQLYPSQKAAKAYVDNAIYNAVGTGVADATTLAPGKIQLAGDLAGTATSPSVPALLLKENIANKSTSVGLGTSDDLYPSQRAVKVYVDQATQGIALQTAVDAKADKNSPSFTGMVSGISKSMVGLANVDNTSDATKPISLATQRALDGKAALDSPGFIGTPSLPTGTTAVTQSPLDNSSKIATTSFVATAISSVSGNAGVPYTGATRSVDLGNYELTANGIVVGNGGGDTTNTSIGNLSMRGNVGVRNTAVGYSSLKSNLAGTDNTALGYNALKSNTSKTNPTLMGSYNSAMGSYSLQSNTTGVRNSAHGAFSLQNNTTGYDNSAFGYSSLKMNTTGYRNTSFGSYSLIFNETGYENTAIGMFSLQQNTDGIGNTASGYYSLTNNKSGKYNTANGYKSLLNNTLGDGNTALGYQSLPNNNEGYYNTALGSYSLFYNTNGYHNTAVGYSSLQSNKSGIRNTGIGFYTLLNNTTGEENIGIGPGAGNAITTGNRNTIIGVNADVSSNNLFNTTVIGYNARATNSNSVVLGNSMVYKIGGQVSWTSASDVRIKKNITDTHYGLSTVMQLRPVEYTLISNELKQVGFIAQEVNKLVPEVITGIEGDLEKGEILGITYANLIPVLTKAIQEQQKQLEAQSKKIDYLLKLVGDKNNR